MEKSLNGSNGLEKTSENEVWDQTILPRSAWNSNVTYLRNLFKAKKALDRIEKEAGIIK